MPKMTTDEVVNIMLDSLAGLPDERLREIRNDAWETLSKIHAMDAVRIDKQRNALGSSKANALYEAAFKQRNTR
jgi:hypothetical protein